MNLTRPAVRRQRLPSCAMDHTDQTKQRLEKVEEHAAFSERTIEQISGEVFELSKRLADVAGRLGRLEEKLGGLADTVAQSLVKDVVTDERPPHAIDRRDDDLKN